MLLDAFTPHLDLGVLAILILVLLLIDSNLICLDPKAKAKKIVRLFSIMTKQKIEINKLLNISIQVKEIKLVLSKILITQDIIHNIINRLDDNSKTKNLKESLCKQITELYMLEFKLVSLLVKKRNNKHTTTLDVYDDVMEILICFRPIYNKIHNQVEIEDLIL